MEYYGMTLHDSTVALAAQAEADCAEAFARAQEVCMRCSGRVLEAFRTCKVSSSDFLEVTGYGFYDGGRDKLEQVYARIFGAEDALVRVQLMSGTHALCVALGGLLHHGETLLSITGLPYETLQAVIGITGDSRNSLKAHGVNYEQIDLVDSEFDLPAIEARCKQGGIRVVAIQRSRGYAARKSLTVEKIGQAIAVVKQYCPDAIVMVDNCYGDFTEEREPTHVGADLIVGSMMKNLGGGLAVTGGYCVGRADVIRDVAERLTAPSIGKELGANMNQLASLFKGLFFAPSTVCAALKSMIFAARLLELAGFDHVDPLYNEPRTDIVQTVDLQTAENLIRFCCGVQGGSPVEAYVAPEPGPMPGYEHEEIMASGTFVTGATSELSCDGPLCPPYTAYMQGSLTYEYGKLGVMYAVDAMLHGN